MTLAFSLYDATVPQYLQLLPGVIANLDRAEARAREKGLTAKQMLGSRLAPDMLPLSVQFRFAATNSGGAIRALTDGVYRIPTEPPPQDFDGIRALLTDALTILKQASPEQVNGAEEARVGIDFQGRVVMHFTGANYLMSFAQPNFYFHAMTVYAILRNMGLALGKSDYLGTMRPIPPA